MAKWHYGNKKWQRIRRKVLDESNWKCRLCGKYANEVDHIKPIYKGGSEYETENTQALCRDCHINKSRLERGVSPSYVAHSQEWDILISQLVREG